MWLQCLSKFSECLSCAFSPSCRWRMRKQRQPIAVTIHYLGKLRFEMKSRENIYLFLKLIFSVITTWNENLLCCFHYRLFAVWIFSHYCLRQNNFDRIKTEAAERCVCVSSSTGVINKLGHRLKELRWRWVTWGVVKTTEYRWRNIRTTTSAFF